MARLPLKLKIALENVHCFDEGDGLGNAEPYLWPVFFKIDGDNFAVESGSGLIGSPVIVSRNGHHGNLGNTDVDAGDNVAVPTSLGVFNTTLKPIPINDPIIKAFIGDDLPAIAGVVVVLMEEDSWPDSLADTGYNALVNSVTLSVAQIAAGFQHATSAPTKAQINAAIKTVTDTAAGMVKDSIIGAMSAWELIWFGTFGNNDDTIGSDAFTFTSDDFGAHSVIDFSKHWGADVAGDGDWSISGTATGTVVCPADALSHFLNGDAAPSPSGSDASVKVMPADSMMALATKSLSAMRSFREKGYSEYPGLEQWWRAMHNSTSEFIYAVAKNPAIRDAAKRLLSEAANVLSAPDKPLTDTHLKDIENILKEISDKHPKLRDAFANQALTMIPKLKGKTFKSAVKFVSDTNIITAQEDRRSRKGAVTTKK